MAHWLTLLVFVLVCLINCGHTLEIVSRLEWGARKPKEHVATDSALLVVIHHSFIPKACFTRDNCSQAMRYMQNFHMDSRGWSDIAYNFAIGGDAVYEGRGWQVVGAHAKGHNNNSLGIVFIGDYREKSPNTDMLTRCIELIKLGVARRYVQPNYQLVGHRQVGNTECPGDALYKVILRWHNWVPLLSKNNTLNRSKENLSKSLHSTDYVLSFNALLLTVLYSN